MIKTRFCPSPTGMLHLGNVRTAVFCALYARKKRGAFILRIEDTDKARSEQRYIVAMQEDLHWLGLAWQEGPSVGGDNGPYLQSERHDIYEQYYEKLIKANRAYPCFCSDQELALNRKLQLSRGQAPRYPGTCKKLTNDQINEKITNGQKPALRFSVPENKVIEFIDLVKGPQKYNSDDIGDFIIRRAEGTSSFLFCNAIDDSLMGVTHVVRGEDHLTNTPRQLMLLDALTLRKAEYGHLSLILGEDGSQLSKRHGSFGVHDLRLQGFLPQALLNYLARLSHNYDQQQLLTFDELAEHFSFEKISRSPARFDHNQLLHWQKETVMKLDDAEIENWLGVSIKNKVPEIKWPSFIKLMRQNCLFPQDVNKWADILFEENLNFTAADQALLIEAGANFFLAAIELTKQFGTDFPSFLKALKEKSGYSGKRLFLPIRIALTGLGFGPELPQLAELLGEDQILQRFEHAQSLTLRVHDA